EKLRAFAAAEGYPTAFSQQFKAGDRDVKIVLHRGGTLELHVETKDGHRPVAGAQAMVAVGDEAGLDDPKSTGTMLYGTTGPDGVAVIPARAGLIEMVMDSSDMGLAMGSPNREAGDFTGG